MQSSVQKWGNSNAVRIPKPVLEAVSLKENDRVEIVAEDGQIIIKKALPARKRLDILLEGFQGEYHMEEIDWGQPEGNEVW